MEVNEMPKEQNINFTLYAFPTVKSSIDRKTIEECSNKNELIVTVEGHNVIGGFGSAVSEILAELSRTKAKTFKMRLDDKYQVS